MSTQPEVEAGKPVDAQPASARHGALVGLLSGAVALGVAELVAALVGPGSSPLVAVGGTMIDASPEWLKAFAIRTFGERDKLALLVGIGAVLAAVAIGLGIASGRRPRLAVGGLVALGAIGAAAAVTRPGNGIAAALPSLAGTATGLVAFLRLRDAAEVEAPPVHPPRIPGYDRRRFLRAGATAAGLAAVAGGLGRILVSRAGAAESRASARIPSPADPTPAPPADPALEIPGLPPYRTPNEAFYRVDTALFVPAIDAATWSLRIHGMVDRELMFDYDQLLARPLIERDVTLACVSNEVGGSYVGNATWAGAPLAHILEEAGIRPGATQLVSRSVDGFTIGTPTAVVMDGRDAMLAVAMNGEPLPLEHGFPVRMVVPGLYGYVSATKWLVDLELTTLEAYDAYWIVRGWAKEAPVKTQSRIDTPRANATVAAGMVPVAGVAWAQHRGIDRVEVQVDGGDWAEARLGIRGSIDTWRQWVYGWQATPGRHTIAVRATDGDGETQTAGRADPFPDGATGHHTISVEVT
jgi:DMSO/TMAO reductase YedYZ molybdopterin-dependent catalytic subunit